MTGSVAEPSHSLRSPRQVPKSGVIGDAMKLNIGCGFNKLDGYVNVDQFPECAPDVLWNLEETPWPLEENSVEELAAHHVLEHLGQETKVFFAIIKELYRLMSHGGRMKITVPHPYHPDFHFRPHPCAALHAKYLRDDEPTQKPGLGRAQRERHHAGAHAGHKFRDGERASTI